MVRVVMQYTVILYDLTISITWKRVIDQVIFFLYAAWIENENIHYHWDTSPDASERQIFTSNMVH